MNEDFYFRQPGPINRLSVTLSALPGAIVHGAPTKFAEIPRGALKMTDMK